jgi:hypothetical protein
MYLYISHPAITLKVHCKTMPTRYYTTEKNGQEQGLPCCPFPYMFSGINDMYMNCISAVQTICLQEYYQQKITAYYIYGILLMYVS